MPHLSAAAFSKQFRRADRSGARWAVVIGDAEAQRGEVLLRDLRVSGSELQDDRMPLAMLYERLS